MGGRVMRVGDVTSVSRIGSQGKLARLQTQGMGVKSSDVIAKNGKLKDGQRHRARSLTLVSAPPAPPGRGPRRRRGAALTRAAAGSSAPSG